jgi:hypothetical protein
MNVNSKSNQKENSNTAATTSTAKTKPAATLSLSNLNLNLSSKKRKKSFISTFRSRNSFDLISKSSCEFIDTLGSDDAQHVKILPSSDSINNITMDNFSMLNDFKNLNRQNFKFNESAAVSSSDNSVRKLNSGGRHRSLCELNKLEQKNFFIKNLPNDQLVPFNVAEHGPTSTQRTEAVSSSEVKNSDFEHFPKLNFYKQCDLVQRWFGQMNDENKNNLLSMLMV